MSNSRVGRKKGKGSPLMRMDILDEQTLFIISVIVFGRKWKKARAFGEALLKLVISFFKINFNSKSRISVFYVPKGI